IDTGKGIDKENLELIFEPFKQEKSHFIAGTGLGLSIAKSIILLLGGTIEVESEPNHGSTFIFKIPITEPSESSIEHLSIISKTDDVQDFIVREGTLAWLADDKSENRILIKTLLEQMNFTVETFNNGKEIVN